MILFLSFSLIRFSWQHHRQLDHLINHSKCFTWVDYILNTGNEFFIKVFASLSLQNLSNFISSRNMVVTKFSFNHLGKSSFSYLWLNNKFTPGAPNKTKKCCFGGTTAVAWVAFAADYVAKANFKIEECNLIEKILIYIMSIKIPNQEMLFLQVFFFYIYFIIFSYESTEIHRK